MVPQAPPTARVCHVEALFRLDPQVQLQFAVDPIHAFVVPAVALHVAQI